MTKELKKIHANILRKIKIILQFFLIRRQILSGLEQSYFWHYSIEGPVFLGLAVRAKASRGQTDLKTSTSHNRKFSFNLAN